MRSAGVRGLLIYCSDYHCSHSTAISGDRWPDDVRLSDLEAKFVCRARGTPAAITFGLAATPVPFLVIE